MKLPFKVLASAAAVALALLLANLADAQPAGAGGAPPLPRPAPDAHDANPQPLTPEQLAKVKSVLARYKAATLTADDAKAIQRALRDAGLRRGPSLGAALKANGFDPDRLEQLDPRPNGPPAPRGDGPPPAR
jgi:hypothetical protein